MGDAGVAADVGGGAGEDSREDLERGGFEAECLTAPGFFEPRRGRLVGGACDEEGGGSGGVAILAGEGYEGGQGGPFWLATAAWMDGEKR